MIEWFCVIACTKLHSHGSFFIRQVSHLRRWVTSIWCWSWLLMIWIQKISFHSFFFCWCALAHCVCNLKEAMNGIKSLDDLAFMAYVRRSSSHLQCYNVYVDYPPFDMVNSFYWCFDIVCVCIFYHWSLCGMTLLTRFLLLVSPSTNVLFSIFILVPTMDKKEKKYVWIIMLLGRTYCCKYILIDISNTHLLTFRPFHVEKQNERIAKSSYLKKHYFHWHESIIIIFSFWKKHSNIHSRHIMVIKNHRRICVEKWVFHIVNAIKRRIF